MATIQLTSTAAQDAAVNRRRLLHNAATGESLTAVQYAIVHLTAKLDGWVTDDANSELVSAKDRWLRSNTAQRTAALNQLEP